MRGANVIIANRTLTKAEELASAISPTTKSVSLEDLAAGKLQGDVLANTTSIGMKPDVDNTPVPSTILSNVGAS